MKKGITKGLYIDTMHSLYIKITLLLSHMHCKALISHIEFNTFLVLYDVFRF